MGGGREGRGGGEGKYLELGWTDGEKESKNLCMDGRDRDMRVYGEDGVGLREARSDMGRGTLHPKPSTPLLSCLPGTQLLNRCNIGLNCSALLSQEAKKGIPSCYIMTRPC